MISAFGIKMYKITYQNLIASVKKTTQSEKNSRCARLLSSY
jgi:hypothetical protein